MNEQIHDRLARIKEQIEEYHRPSLEDAKLINDLLWRYKKALEGLTPNGSEFVNDPEYCAEFIRERQRGWVRRLGEAKRKKANQ